MGVPASEGEKQISRRGRWLVLAAALLGWMFDGFEMGIFPLVARPALIEVVGLSADARLIFSVMSVLMPRCGSYFAIFARPLSITSVTPSMVKEVSATLVETTIFLSG